MLPSSTLCLTPDLVFHFFFCLAEFSEFSVFHHTTLRRGHHKKLATKFPLFIIYHFKPKEKTWHKFDFSRNYYWHFAGIGAAVLYGERSSLCVKLNNTNTRLSQQVKNNSTTEFSGAASWHINQTLCNSVYNICSAKFLVKISALVLNLITWWIKSMKHFCGI